VTASSPAHQRRKQHAPARQSGGRSHATRKATRGARRPQTSSGGPRGNVREALGERASANARGLLGRLRERIAGRRRFARTPKHAEPAASPTPDHPREWPRRLGVAALKFGSAAAVAWALLVAGREVYEYATTSSRFEVQHFIYQTTTHVDDEQLRTLLSLEPGTNILACDLPGISERIAAHPWVAQATVIRHLPDTLEVTLVEHQPEAIVLAERFYLVNGEGKPFKPVERGERGELPIITGIDRAQLADNRDAAVVRINSALALIRLYGAKQRPRLGEIHIDEDGEITLYTAEAGTQLRLGRGGFEDRLARWDALRAALGDRADRLAVVHLDHESKPDRRDRVVARFANERDEAVLLAAAAGELDQDLESPELAADQPARELPARGAGHRKRIPRYE
jgi:cell division protein FtsQ